MYDIAKKIVLVLHNAGYIAYFAGGYVRDRLLHIPSEDIDIATNASPEVVQKLFPKTIPVGIHFGIVIVIQNGLSFEVATFRKEGRYMDGRHPSSVEFTSPQEDAKRRDFTINGMFFDPIEEKVIDYVQGQIDLNQKLIRAIGDPDQRLEEDRLRLVRAARLANRFHFSIEKKTKEAIVRHAPSLFPSVAIERVVQELYKMDDLRTGLLLLQELRILPILFSSLPQYSQQELSLLLTPLDLYPQKAPLIAFLLPLFPNASLSEQIDLALYLKLPKKEILFLQFLEKGKGLIDRGSDWEWAHYYADNRAWTSLKIIAAHRDHPDSFMHSHRQKYNELLPYIQRIQEKTPLITASTLQKLHILPGKIMGELLREAEKISIEKKLCDPEKVLILLQTTKLWPIKDG
ncbi:MAG: CCA tRNA nucleotidyltransferase [Parachlamydiales bacterium]|nr:CCA tRNA nucleotidyltransferase [Parachlamydiales bacterium]